MKMNNGTRFERLRIILAIAGKDIVDALRNRIVLTIIIGVALVMVQGKALPLLLKLSDTVQVVVYNEGVAPIVADLRSHGGIRVIETESQQDLEQALVEASGESLGIVIPVEYGEEPGPTGELRLEGFYPYWMNLEVVAELETLVEGHLTGVTGHTIHVDTEGHVIYAQPDSGGQLFMTALVMVLMSTLICLIIVPYLMIEEKEANTIDALLVSPARIGEVVIGKALAGLTYGLAAGAVVLAFFHAHIVHWWIAILACVAGSLFAVAVGLLLGTLFENIANMNLWMSLVLVFLAAPVLVVRYLPPQWPAIIGNILPWMPTVALYNTYLLSFTANPSLAQVGMDLGLLFGSAAVVLAIVTWIVRRSDR
jgi:ABC-2 type transport system permease protein